MNERLVPSRHCMEDRVGRITFIATTLGFGQIIQKRTTYSNGQPSIRCLTDTGVIICKTMDESKVITMFIATTRQVVDIYGGGHVPNWIYNKAKKNKKFLKMQDSY